MNPMTIQIIKAVYDIVMIGAGIKVLFMDKSEDKDKSK